MVSRPAIIISRDSLGRALQRWFISGIAGGYILGMTSCLILFATVPAEHMRAVFVGSLAVAGWVVGWHVCDLIRFHLKAREAR